MKDPSGRLVLVYSREQIAERVRQLAAIISASTFPEELTFELRKKGASKIKMALQHNIKKIFPFSRSSGCGDRGS
jgi:hypothetical protein